MAITQLASKRLLAISATCILGWAFCFLATNVFRAYAYGLFIWLPLAMGFIASVLVGYRTNYPKHTIRNTAYLSLLIFCIGLLLFAFEGVICIFMAAPLGFLFTWIGYKFGYLILKRQKTRVPLTLFMIITSVPFFMAFENSSTSPINLRSVTTSVDIHSPIDSVWKRVISFPKLKPPSEFIFNSGIAYPTDATITGQGLGAIRHCNFNTGCFVEPITVWNEPTLLQFSVLEQPEPMKELTPYNIHPNHLHGYWVSEKGQFQLTQLAGGYTRLTGTTWYKNRIAPDFYWSLWSDYIVHKIHQRVLTHIKKLTESIN